MCIRDRTRKTIFPDKFSVPGFGTIHTGQSLAIDEATRSMLQHGRQEVTLYGLGTQYGHLKPTDVALVDGQTSRSAEKLYTKVTNIRTMKAELLLKQSKDNPTMLHDMERQIGRALKASEKVRVVEAVAIYEWQIDQNRPLI